MTWLERFRRRVLPGQARVFLFWITLLALVIRLVWNLGLHPPRNFIDSDMLSYWEQSTAMLKAPWARDGNAVFFPYGTALLLSVVRGLFGRDNHLALAIVFAGLGTALVPLVYFLAERLTGAWLMARVAALITCFYYPFISYGGYYLSELPFTVCVTATALYSLRLVDRGSKRDAWWTGLAIAAGAMFRPQMLTVVPLLFVVWVWRRREWMRFRFAHWVRVVFPVVVMVVISMMRFHYHTGRWGLISGNADLNYAFARCHASTIESRAPRYRASYSPPPFGYLEYRENRRPPTWIRLDPAFGPTLKVQGPLWTPETFAGLTQKCVEKTGYERQLRYVLMHIVMMWGYNNAWPDSGEGAIRFVMLIALGLHNAFLLLPMGVMFVAALRRRFVRYAVLGVHFVGLLVLALIYFGDVRYRIPYDGLAIVLGLDGWRRIYGWFGAGRWHRWR